MVTETVLHYRQPCYDSVRMAQHHQHHHHRQQYSPPTPDTVSSAADAMLKLSATGGQSQSQHHEYSMYHHNSPKQGSDGGGAATSMYGEYHMPASTSMAAVTPTVSSAPSVSPTLSIGSGSLSPRARSSSFSRLQRKEREFVPDFRKDGSYWVKRQKNNEAAKRSREKRRINDMVMSDKLNEVLEEKNKVQAELDAIKKHFGLPLDKPFKVDSCNSQSTSHSVSPASSPGKATDTTRSSPTYSMHNGSPIKPAPPLIPLQGRLAEVIAKRMMSKPPPLEPVPDSPPISSPPVYQHQMSSYSNGSSSSQQQYHSQPQQQHYTTSPQIQPQYNSATTTMLPIKIQPESPQTASTTDQQHQQQFQYPMHHYPCSQSPRSPQSLHIAMSPQESSDRPPSSPPHADREGHRAQENHGSYGEVQENHGAPLNLSKRRRMDFTPSEESENHQTLKVRTPAERKGIPHKLRYKNYSSEIREAEQDVTSPEASISSTRSWHLPAPSPASSQLSIANINNHNQKQDYSNNSHGLNLNHNMHQNSYGRNETDLNRSLNMAQNSYKSNHHVATTEPQDIEMAYNRAQAAVGQFRTEDPSPHTDEPSNDGSSDNNQFEHYDDTTEDVEMTDAADHNGRYQERRHRNNVAARKCRENRRTTTELRVAKSQVLESENDKLKDELRNLSEEVNGLKKLMERKHQAENAGETFQPPPLENLISDADDE